MFVVDRVRGIDRSDIAANPMNLAVKPVDRVSFVRPFCSTQKLASISVCPLEQGQRHLEVAQKRATLGISLSRPNGARTKDHPVLNPPVGQREATVWATWLALMPFSSWLLRLMFHRRSEVAPRLLLVLKRAHRGVLHRVPCGP